MKRLIAAAALFTFAVGCVPKHKYDDELAAHAMLQTQVDGLQKDVAERDATIARLEAELATATADLAAGRQQLDDASSKLAGKVAETGALQADIEKMKRALAELEKRKAEADASLKSFKDLVARFQSMIDAGTLRVRVIDGRMVVELATDILFPAGQATLSPEGKKTIAEVGTVLASIAGREFQVAGHTDNVPISTDRFPSNWDLGAARAITVTRLLIDSGLPATRVSAASYAETKPTDTNDTKEGKARNRRIEIIIVPDLSLMPGYEELKSLSK